MSVPTETARIQYTLSGAGQALPVPFRFLSNAHIRAIHTLAGNDIDLIENTDYSLMGAGNPAGGTLTMVAGVAGNVVTILRNVPATQLVSYVENDEFPATVQESALDKLTHEVQQLKGELSRCLRLADSAAAVSPLAASIPNFADLLAILGSASDFVSAPATMTSAGALGQRAYADGYFYICVLSGAEGFALWIQISAATNW